MIKYEYCSLHRYSNLSDEEWLDSFNKLGEQGWELVSVTPDTAEYNSIAYFKRIAG